MKKTIMVLTAAVLLGFSSASAERGFHGSCNRDGGGRDQGCGITMMEERLGLNDKQSEKIEELQANQFRKAAAERRKLAVLERELQTESLKANTDNKKIEQVAEKIGKQHAALARLRSAHVTEMAAILTPAQRDSMRTMMDGQPGRGNCTIKRR